MGEHEPVPPTGQPRTRRRRFAELAIALVVAAVALLVVSRFLDFPPAYVQGRPFHDALGLFSATIPDGWTVTGGAIPMNTEGPCGGQSFPSEDYTFHDQQKGDLDATVEIGVAYMNTPELRAQMCHQIQFPKRFIDGLPASSDDLNSNAGYTLPPYYAFYSGNAAFGVVLDIPTTPTVYNVAGTTGVLPTPTVTDPGPASSQADALINSISVTDHWLC
jgi:hypothetical protein